ncbi:hypothetical protein [Undibacterium sp. TC4M20W]|uniref:hypothetical protein n=1 Tax=Undibacterium sp. TC4M20W TaxID=3413052 RepID=UPI003BF5EF16
MMVDVPRKKSPRAPSMSLNEALDRAIKVYEKERLHPAPTEVVAADIGYRNANSGAATSAIASLRSFGLLARSKDGVLVVSKDVESFRFAPDEGLRRVLLRQFLKTPPLYAELLEKFESGLPSDANLKYELIQRGFIPASADSALIAFKQSVAFAGYYDDENTPDIEPEVEIPIDLKQEETSRMVGVQPLVAQPTSNFVAGLEEQDIDRIPVRLPGGRRAWLLIPIPFYEADKQRLKAQIDLLLTEDGE